MTSPGPPIIPCVRVGLLIGACVIAATHGHLVRRLVVRIQHIAVSRHRIRDDNQVVLDSSGRGHGQVHAQLAPHSPFGIAITFDCDSL